MCVDKCVWVYNLIYLERFSLYQIDYLVTTCNICRAVGNWSFVAYYNETNVPYIARSA